MLTPATTRDWIAFFIISSLGIAALVWLLPLSARVPFLVPPDIYARFLGNGASQKPFAGLMTFTPVLVGIAIVASCLVLWGLWLNWSMSRPA